MPVNDKANGSGGTKKINFCHVIHNVEIPGIKIIPARIMPTRARFFADQLSARRIRKFTEASSRKSILSAKRETEPMERAIANSTKKNNRFAKATK